MADDPNKPLGDRDKVAREVGARVGYGWIWIWIVIIVILVIWFGGFGWGGYGGWWWGRGAHRAMIQRNPDNGGTGFVTSQRPAPEGSAAVLGGPGVQILSATNKQLFVGKPFAISNVPIQETENDRVFWIGADNSDTMLVVLTKNQNSVANASIQQGTRVNVIGTVARAPSASNAKRMWGLSDADAKRLEQQGVFIQATKVQAGRQS